MQTRIFAIHRLDTDDVLLLKRGIMGDYSVVAVQFANSGLRESLQVL